MGGEEGASAEEGEGEGKRRVRKKQRVAHEQQVDVEEKRRGEEFVDGGTDVEGEDFGEELCNLWHVGVNETQGVNETDSHINSNNYDSYESSTLGDCDDDMHLSHFHVLLPTPQTPNPRPQHLKRQDEPIHLLPTPYSILPTP